MANSSDSIRTNDGHPMLPSLSFISNPTCGLYLKDTKELAIASTGQILATFDNNKIEFFKNLKISNGASNGALLTSDVNGNATWEVSKSHGEFKWNSLYASLDLETTNNINTITFPANLKSKPSISLTKESNHVVDNFDLYIKNVTSEGFTIYSNSFMSKQILNLSIGDYSVCRLANNTDIGICYYNNNSDRIEFITIDNNCQILLEPIIIDNISTSNICEMIIVDGHPAIVYIADNGEEDEWRYIRASNAAGSVWSSPITLLTSTEDITFLTNTIFLRIVDGVPAVFLNTETGRAKIIKSSDLDGTTWNSPINISNLTNHQILDVKIIQGNPAIIAKSNVTNYLYYVRSSNINGVSWPVGATQLFKTDSVALAVNDGKCCNTLDIINNTVCIITSELSTNIIHITQANDNYGTTWKSGEVLVTSNTNNAFPRIFKNNDTTYMIYNDYTGSPSEKNIIEFSTTKLTEFNKTSGFIKSLNFCTDHQILSNITDGNNVIIMASENSLSFLKFYGNDLSIHWSALT